MLSVKTTWAATERAVVDEIVILIIFDRGKSVVSKNVKTWKPVLKLSLQRVIAIVSIVAEIVDTLSPAETIEERLAGILRSRSCYWLVGVIRRAITGKDVSSFVSHITHVERGVV